MASKPEIDPVINSFIDPDATNIQCADDWENTRRSNNVRIQNVSLSDEMDPNFHMPQAISDDNMEVDFDPHSVFVQNDLPMNDTSAADFAGLEYLLQMIQSIHYHSEILLNHKETVDELKTAQAKFNSDIKEISTDYFNLLKFSSPCLKKLNPNQKKEFYKVRKDILSLLKSHFTEVYEMLNKDLDSTNASGFQEIENLKKGIKALKVRLQIAKEEKAAANKLREENDHMYLVLEARRSEQENLNKRIKELKDSYARYSPEQTEENIADISQKGIRENEELRTCLEEREQSSCSLEGIPSFDMHVVSLITIYFGAHPFGVSIDRIHYYVSNILPEIKIDKIRSLMLGLPNMFKLEISGIDNTETWHFVNHPFKIYKF